MTSPKSTPDRSPRPSLKDRLKKPGGISAAEAVRRGQDALNQMRGDYKQQLVQDIAALTRLAREKPKVYAPKEHWHQQLVHKLSDMRGVAGSFDYPLVTAVCDTFLDYVLNVADYNIEDDTHFDAILRAHLDALQHIATDDIRGPGGPREESMLQDLRSQVAARKADTTPGG